MRAASAACRSVAACAYPSNRIEPLVVRHIADGYRIGGPQNAQNPPEADAIVAQIVGCIEDPRYNGATMGVISLQGESQAKLIERKLLDTLDPEVIEKRRLISGDADCRADVVRGAIWSCC